MVSVDRYRLVRGPSLIRPIILLGNILFLTILCATGSWAGVPGNQEVTDGFFISEHRPLQVALADMSPASQLSSPSPKTTSAGVAENLGGAGHAGANGGLVAALSDQGELQHSATLVAVSLQNGDIIATGGIGQDGANLFAESRNSEFPLSVVIALIALVSLVSIARRR